MGRSRKVFDWHGDSDHAGKIATFLEEEIEDES
jgi:hypothetical protein